MIYIQINANNKYNLETKTEAKCFIKSFIK